MKGVKTGPDAAPTTSPPRGLRGQKGNPAQRRPVFGMGPDCFGHLAFSRLRRRRAVNLFAGLAAAILGAALAQSSMAAQHAISDKPPEPTAPGAPSPQNAQAVKSPVPDPGYQQAVQQQVRDMARRLVNELISSQIVQLEENGLGELPLYGELREMQQHLDELVDQHMQEVLALLAEMAQAPAEKQLSILATAREKSRAILAQLVMERQRVLRRLRLAEIEELARQLISREEKVREKTDLLSAVFTPQQAAQALSVQEDQRDVFTVYGQVEQFLTDISTWGGQVGRTADLALAALHEQKVDQLFRESLQALGQARFGEALTKEADIIRALENLLKRIQTLRGEFEAEGTEAMRELLEQLAQRQAELRRQTAEAEAAEEFERLTERQLEIRNAITEAAKKLSSQSPPSLEQAAQAAARAAEQLFRSQPEDALQKQQEVIEHLARAQNELAQAKSPQSVDSDLLDPERARQEEADLAAAREELRRLRAEQARASQLAVSNQIPTAAEEEKKISTGLSHVPEGKQLPEAVNRAIDQASQTVGEVAKGLTELAHKAEQSPGKEAPASGPQESTPSPQPQGESPSSGDFRHPSEDRSSPESPAAGTLLADSNPEPLTRRAEQAIDEALSAVETALADARRRRLAAEVVEQVRRAWQTPPGSEAAQWEKAHQTAAQLQEVTASQLAQAKDARQQVESYLPRLAENERMAQALEALQRAQRHVVEAAARQAAAAGNPETAESLRQAPSPEEAAKVLRQTAERPVRQEPTAPGEPTDQTQVTEEIHRAEESLENLPPLPADDGAQAVEEGAKALQKARELSRQAEDLSGSSEPGSREQLPAVQQEVIKGLASALEELQKAEAQIARATETPLTAHAQSARRLAPAAIPVHPEATSHLHAAENSARQAVGQTAEPEAIAAAQTATSQAFAGAVSALAERERQLAAALEAAQRLPEIMKAPPQANNGPPLEGHQAGAESPEPIAAALARLQALAAQAASGHANGEEITAPTAQSLTPGEGQTDSQAADAPSPTGQGGAARAGGQTQNRPAPQAPLQPGNVAQTDSRAGVAGQLTPGDGKEPSSAPPWLLQLPPEVRNAIRAGMSVPVPKGYEDRLRRYFQNMESP